MLGIKHIVIHPGYHGGAGIEQGLKKIALSIDMVYEKLPNIDVSITLETTAGQGTSIGFRFEHLREVIDNSNYKEKISVCIDTAHIFEAGYDIRSYDKYNETMNEFCEIIGLKNLKVIHINDSKTTLGSNVDRHEHIGKGKIGIDAFRFIMNDRRLANIPKILETPKGEDLKEDIENLDTLKNLVDKI
jgi:deoxyribonuclease-4